MQYERGQNIRSVVFDPFHVPGPRFGRLFKSVFRLRRWSCWEILGILTGVRVVKTGKVAGGGGGGNGWLVD